MVMEHMGMGPEFHPLLWMMVPIGYSSYRLSSLKTWVLEALIQFLAAQGALGFMGANLPGFMGNNLPGFMSWETFNLLLALSNAIFWSYNLFVTLTLRILPQCMNQDNFPSTDVSWNYMLPSVKRSTTLKI